MRFWIDDYRDPIKFVKDWGEKNDVWSKSFAEFMKHLQIHLNDDIRIGHIYFDYNLGRGETGFDCARLIPSEDWEWALDENTTWSSHSSDTYGRAR